MSAGEGDQVLVCLFRRAEALTEVGNRPFLEGDDRGHGLQDTPAAVNFLQPQEIRGSAQNKGGGAFRHRRPNSQK